MTATAVQTVLSHPVCTISPLVAKMKEHFLSLDIPLPISSMPYFDLKPVESNGPEIVTWFLDTRTMWPGENIFTAKGAAEALSLISQPEQNVVTTKMFVADARMSLGSALLKRLFVSLSLIHI